MELLSPSMIKFLGVEECLGANKLLEFNLHRLRILGIWKWDVPHWRLHKAFAFLTIIALILCDVTLICDAYIYITDLERLAKLILSSIFTWLLAFKNTYLLIRTYEASELIDQLQNKFFTNERLPTSQQTMILNRYAARARLYTVIRSNAAMGICIFWILYPIKEMLGEYTEEMDSSQDGNDAESNNNRTVILQLPFVAYFPYDVEHNVLYFILTYFYQSFLILSVFIGMPAWDMLFVSLFIHTSGHFKALQHVLIHLHENYREAVEANMNQLQLQEGIQSSEQTGIEGSSVWTMVHDSEEHAREKLSKNGRRAIQAELMEQDVEEQMQNILNKCIQHHQALLSFVKKLEDFLRPVMLMQLLVSMIAFCIIGFEMSLVPISTESTKFVKLFVSLVSALVEEGMFYWFGGELLEEISKKTLISDFLKICPMDAELFHVDGQSSKTLTAAYCCEWYNANSKFKKHLHILMERAKIPVKLTAGGFSTLTAENFSRVVQSSYQYFTMLKAMHNGVTD